MSDGSLATRFMGCELPPKIGYYTFPCTVEFRRVRGEGLDGQDDLGCIPTPYDVQTREWWLEQATAILAKHKIKWEPK